MKAEDKIEAARLSVCRRWPYMSTAVLSMVSIERESVPTMAVDAKWRLYWNREFVDKHNKAELEFAIAHEAMHLVLGHPRRGQAVVRESFSRNHFIWNLAADCAVNSMLVAEGWQGIDGMVMPEQFGLENELSVDEYYRAILQQFKDKQQEQGDSDDDGDGDNSQYQFPGGSCADGIQRPWEGSLQDEPLGDGGSDGDTDNDDSGDSASCSDAGDVPVGVDSHDSDRIVNAVVEAIKARGAGSASARRLIDQLEPANIDPRKLLRMAIVRHLQGSDSGPGTSSYRRPARRQPVGKVLRPRSIRPCPQVAVIVDTSGSMSRNELATGLGLIGQVLASLRSSDGVRVVSGDVGACTDAKVFRPDQVSLAGGGGTDMGAIIEEVAASKQPCDLAIVVTDGYTPWPDKKQRFPVVACITGGNSTREVPSWIKAFAI